MCVPCVVCGMWYMWDVCACGMYWYYEGLECVKLSGSIDLATIRMCDIATVIKRNGLWIENMHRIVRHETLLWCYLTRLCLSGTWQPTTWLKLECDIATVIKGNGL